MSAELESLASLAYVARLALGKLPPEQRETAQQALEELAAKVAAMAGRELRGKAKKWRGKKA